MQFPDPETDWPLARSSPTHALTKVVFPKPAGAETRVRSRVSVSLSRSISLGRRTSSGRMSGTNSFVVRISSEGTVQPIPAVPSISLAGAVLKEEINCYELWTCSSIRVPAMSLDGQLLVPPDGAIALMSFVTSSIHRFTLCSPQTGKWRFETVQLAHRPFAPK